MLLDGIGMSWMKRMPRYERGSSEADKRCMIAG
jgi:hypothetical protein